MGRVVQATGQNTGLQLCMAFNYGGRDELLDAVRRLARRVADYIAGMTDRYAILEHRRLFDVTPDLR